MTVRPLHLLGSPVLRQRSPEIGVVDDAVRAFVADLFETMRASNGVGLAANQVGVARRVAVVETEDARLVLIDPVILETEGRESAEEGCLSIPEVYAEVTRPSRVKVEATDLEGARYTWEGEGLAARAVQHEIDHLDGILFLDHLGPIKRKMLLARYKKEHKDGNYIKEVGSTAAGSP